VHPIALEMLIPCLVGVTLVDVVVYGLCVGAAGVRS